jgi:SAM-dependent methyltransferase
MSQTNPPSNERDLHERVARGESQEAQSRGIVGWFYRTYIEATRDFLAPHRSQRVLDIGCGEGVLLRGVGFTPVQLDISMVRLEKARADGNPLVCADGMELPFNDAIFDVVLLIALLEHVRQPERVIDETWRVLKPGGEVAIVVPNDIWMSLGRLLLLKWPPRHPSHLSWIPPRRLAAMMAGRFHVETAHTLPVKWWPFGLSMYCWSVWRKA